VIAAVDASFHVPGRGGGVETVVRGLLGAWPRGKGDRLVVYVSRPGRGDLPLPEGSRERAVPLARFRGFRTAWQQALLPLVSRDGAHVLFSPANVGPLAGGPPLVLLVHDCSPYLFPSMYSPPERLALRALMAFSARRAAAVVTLGRSVRQEVMELFGLPPARVEDVGAGVDPAFFRPGQAAPPFEARPLAGDYVLYAGKYAANKNLENLLAAMALLEREHGVAAPLVLAGPVDRAGGLLSQLARKAGLSPDRLLFTGRVDRPVLAALMAAARAFVYPSWYEGFGLPVLEAMAAGTPVAASRAVAEAVGDAALLFDPAKPSDMALALAKLCGDRALAADLRERGLARAAEHRGWDGPARAVRRVLARAAGAA